MVLVASGLQTTGQARVDSVSRFVPLRRRQLSWEQAELDLSEQRDVRLAK